jgi:SAM-dependent methyltransferase
MDTRQGRAHDASTARIKAAEKGSLFRNELPRPARDISVEARAQCTTDFTSVYKLVPDPWNISRRVPYYCHVWEWIFSSMGEVVDSITDVGCGVGAFLRSLQLTRPDIPAEGIEYSPEAAERARDATGLTIHEGDIRCSATFERCAPASLVTFNDVLYYLQDEWEQGMANCLVLLRAHFAVISASPNVPESYFARYCASIRYSSKTVSLKKMNASREFTLPHDSGGPNKQRFTLYRVSL